MTLHTLSDKIYRDIKLFMSIDLACFLSSSILPKSLIFLITPSYVMFLRTCG